LTYDDRGLYKLQLTFLNCKGELREAFSNEIVLNVFGETYIAYQTEELYGIKDGFTTMRVEALTSGANDYVPITYQ